MKASVTIGRDSHGRVNIRIKDESSRQTVCEVRLTLEDYAMILTGMYEVEGIVEYGKLSVVGKRKVVEGRTLEIKCSDKDKLREYLLDMYRHDTEWTVDPYLSSQKSIEPLHRDGLYRVNYSVYKYINQEE